MPTDCKHGACGLASCITCRKKTPREALMPERRTRRMFHDCAAHKPECPVHEHPELPTGCTCQVYSHPLCIFNYCPDPQFCKVPGVGCVSHSQDAAKKRLEEQGGTECIAPSEAKP